MTHHLTLPAFFGCVLDSSFLGHYFHLSWAADESTTFIHSDTPAYLPPSYLRRPYTCLPLVRISFLGSYFLQNPLLFFNYAAFSIATNFFFLTSFFFFYNLFNFDFWSEMRGLNIPYRFKIRSKCNFSVLRYDTTEGGDKAKRIGLRIFVHYYISSEIGKFYIKKWDQPHSIHTYHKKLYNFYNSLF